MNWTVGGFTAGLRPRLFESGQNNPHLGLTHTCGEGKRGHRQRRDEMLVFKNGLSFLHHSGKVWIDRSSFAEPAEFYAAGHYGEVKWHSAPPVWGDRFAA